MKKLILIILLVIALNFITSEDFEQEIKLEILPHCYGSNTLIKLEENYLDENDTIQWRPCENATVLIKHFGYIIDSNITNEEGVIKHKFPTANIYGLTVLKEEYPRYHFTEILLRNCLLTPYVPPEREPYIHIPPVVNPPEPLTIDWFRVVLVW